MRGDLAGQIVLRLAGRKGTDHLRCRLRIRLQQGIHHLTQGVELGGARRQMLYPSDRRVGIHLRPLIGDVRQDLVPGLRRRHCQGIGRSGRGIGLRPDGNDVLQRVIAALADRKM